MMNITVNGRAVCVHADQTLLQGLLQNGFQVPNLCHLDGLEPYGGCGLCLVEADEGRKPVRSCAIYPHEGMIVKTDSERIVRSRAETMSLLLSDHLGDCVAPCSRACPAHQDCQGYIGLIACGETEEALRRALDDNPLPASIGRVCPHPCEKECRRALVDEPVSIMRLKRYAADTVGPRGTPSKAAPTGKRVAVVGAGPSGLSCAYFLARAGHDVAVHEAMPKAGGMLRYGIPSYRLDKSVLDAEIARIERLGVRFEYGKKLGADITIDGLRRDYDAVYIALGAWESAALGCENDRLPGVLGGIDFLRSVAEGRAPALGDRVAVVGGGNTAMDAVRTAVRLGAKEVTLLYRRTREEMPAEEKEIWEAAEEGVQFRFLVAPACVLESGGRAAGLKLSRMTLGEPDASGRRRPEPTGEFENLYFDTVIAAIGQKVCQDGIETLDRNRWRTVRAESGTFRTNLDGVFAGGDMVNDGPGIAVAAVAHGKEAAAAIGRYLKGEPLCEAQPSLIKRENVTREELGDVISVPRAVETEVSPAGRISSFAEYEAGLTKEQAVQEANRCLECGCRRVRDCRLLPLVQSCSGVNTACSPAGKKPVDVSHPILIRDANKCILCGLCVRVCHDIVGTAALGFSGRGFDTLAQPAFGLPLAQSNCISCGLCAQVCPTGAITEKRPYRKSPPLPYEKETAVCSYCKRGCLFELQKYGGHILRSLPVHPTESCSLGRFSAVVSQLSSLTEEQKRALQKVLTGDLRSFLGDLPTRIGEVELAPEGTQHTK